MVLTNVKVTRGCRTISELPGFILHAFGGNYFFVFECVCTSGAAGKPRSCSFAGHQATVAFLCLRHCLSGLCTKSLPNSKIAPRAEATRPTTPIYVVNDFIVLDARLVGRVALARGTISRAAAFMCGKPPVGIARRSIFCWLGWISLRSAIGSGTRASKRRTGHFT